MLRFLGRRATLASRELAHLQNERLGFACSRKQCQLQQPPSSATKMARVLSMEVNRIKAQYRMSPSPELKRQCLNELAATPLSRVQQLDVKTVVHMLGALEELKAPADHPVIQEAAEWISKNTESFTSALQLGQALHSVAHLNKSIAADLLAAVQPRIVATLENIDAPSASKLLAAARVAGMVSAPMAPIPAAGVGATCPQVAAPSWQEHCIGVLQKNISSAEPQDLFTMAKALHAYPDESLLYEEIIALAAGKLSRLTNDDLVQIVPLISTSHLSQNIRETRLTEAITILENAVNTLTPFDASVLYVSLKGFDSLDDPLARRIVALIERIPLASASVGEALTIAACLGNKAPRSLVDTICDSVNTHFARITDKPVAEVAALFLALMKSPPLQQRGLVMLLGDRILSELKQMRSTTSAANVNTKQAPSIPADLLAALMTNSMLQMYGTELHGHVLANFEKWSYPDALVFVTAASHVSSNESRRILRDVAQRLAQSVHISTPQQLAVLSNAYGRSGVRNDVLCNAVAEKLVADKATLGIHSISSALAFLAAVDYRNTKCFVELQVRVRSFANNCNPSQAINFIASYSKMLIWNLKLFYPLISRAANLTEFFSIPQIIALLTSVERVEVRHPTLTNGIIRRLRALAPTADAVSSVRLLTALSMYRVYDEELYNVLAAHTLRAAKENMLDASQLGDVLVSFVRVGLTKHSIFEDAIMPVLAVAPTARPTAIAHLATAYSAAGMRHEELFEILAERTLVLKEDCPAVTIASILAAFARIGIRNDKLFIEMICRVKSVPAFGSPQDIVNVVTAYSLAGVWHMRLFTRLGERAVYLRGEFRGSLIAELLAGYAKVQMKFDKLFSEFSPRIQACALTLSPSDLASIVHSFAAVLIPDAAVFEIVGDLLATKVDALTEEEKRAVMTAYTKVGISHNALASALSGLPQTQTESTTPPPSNTAT